jgi:hypothetical protein
MELDPGDLGRVLVVHREWHHLGRRRDEQINLLERVGDGNEHL